MVKVPGWLAAFRHAVRKRLTSLWGRILTLSFLVSVGWWVLDRTAGDRAFSAGKKFFTQTLPEWACQPIGEFWLLAFGLLFVWTAVWIVVVLFLAWRDARPKKSAQEVKPETPSPPPLSADERNSIEAARVFWRSVGDPTTGQIAYALLEQAIEQVVKTTPVANLVREPLKKLRDAREAINNALSDYAQVPLTVVHQRVLSLFVAYMNGVGWLHVFCR